MNADICYYCFTFHGDEVPAVVISRAHDGNIYPMCEGHHNLYGREIIAKNPTIPKGEA